MFRNDNEYDEVSAYKKEQEKRNLDERFHQDERFNNRDDFKYDEDFGKDDPTFRDSDYQPHNNAPKPRKKSKGRNVFTTIITFIFIVSIFSTIVRGCNNFFFEEEPTQEKDISEIVESEDSENNEEDLPLLKSKSMNTSEFLKEYEQAKKNKIVFDRHSRKYLEGDYSQSFTMIEKYFNSEYSQDDTTRYLCISELDDETYKYNHLSCIKEANDFSDLKYPSDFIEAIGNTDISLNDYRTYNTESNVVYVINGQLYTKELIDLIKSWDKTGSFD